MKVKLIAPHLNEIVLVVLIPLDLKVVAATALAIGTAVFIVEVAVCKFLLVSQASLSTRPGSFALITLSLVLAVSVVLAST